MLTKSAFHRINDFRTSKAKVKNVQHLTINFVQFIENISNFVDK